VNITHGSETSRVKLIVKWIRVIQRYLLKLRVIKRNFVIDNFRSFVTTKNNSVKCMYSSVRKVFCVRVSCYIILFYFV